MHGEDAADHEAIERADAEHRARLEKERKARRAAGLGFWRLVWAVALGILFAQGIARAVGLALRILTGGPQ